MAFLYSKVLERPLARTINAVRALRPPRIPVVLSRDEVKAIVALIEGTAQLVVKLLYGSGLRISEAVRLRVQDIDYETMQVTVRSGKGDKDWVTPFPPSLRALLDSHLQKVKVLQGLGGWLWRGLSAVCAEEKVPERGQGVGLAIRVPFPLAGRQSA